MSTSVSVGHRPQPAPGRRPSIRRLAGLSVLTVAIGLGCVETVSAQQDPFMISAFFGLDEGLPTPANAAFLPQFNPWNTASGAPNRANPTQADITGTSPVKMACLSSSRRISTQRVLTPRTF